MNTSKLEEIHDSFVNGQREQAVELIEEYGEVDFFADYKVFVNESNTDLQTIHDEFVDAVLSYFRIKDRKSHVVLRRDRA